MIWHSINFEQGFADILNVVLFDYWCVCSFLPTKKFQIYALSENYRHIVSYVTASSAIWLLLQILHKNGH